jgi:lipopolysaccharide/colanic/teichoic acid biosynthesis glycosyltransferase
MSPRTRRIQLALKRGIDVALAGVALLVASPVMAVIAMAARASMGRPVLFRQIRPGLHGETFVVLKFRTMRAPRGPGREAEEDYGARLTRLGRRLPTTSLDELPQLVNVLRGDLSLVGPRPLLCEYLPLYDAEQARRHDVRPGITGLAQIRGRSTMAMEERFVPDVWYVDHWSLGLDLRILASTALYVLLRRGMREDGRPGVPMWEGNRVDPAAQRDAS